MSGEDPMTEEPVNQKDLETMTRAEPVGAPTAGSRAAAGGQVDQIRLSGVGGIGHHGVLEEERRDGQPFFADLVLAVDTRAAATEDDLTRTVNYAAVAGQVAAVIEGEPVRLIETLAARIAAVALAHEGVLEATVTVHKPEAPVGVPFTDVEVTITRTPADDLPDVDLSAPEQPAAEEPAAPLPPAVPPAAAVDAPEPEPVPDRGEPAVGADLHATPEQPVPVVIALGGNVGDVRSTLRAVVADLRVLPGLSVEEVSPLARTAAVLAPDAVAQPDYLNAVVLATTTLSPMDLLASMQGLENAYGRRRTARWGERTLDLDLIVYDGVTSTDPELSLPHPRASERAFVLVPWAQAAPDAFLPGLGGGPVAALAETAPDRGGVRWLALDWLDDAARPAAPPAPAPEPADAPAAESGPAPEEAAGSGPESVAAQQPAAVPPVVAGPAGGHAVADDGAGAEPVDDDVAEQVDDAAAAEPPADPERVSQWAPENQVGMESQEDLELLAHGDAEPEPVHPAQPSESSQPPVVPPAGRPPRASFPPPAEPVPTPPPAESAPAAAASAEAASAPGAEPEPESPPAPEDELRDEPGAWFDEPVAATPEARNEPSLPWVASPEEARAPRLAPKWQPLRRNDDT